MKLGLAGKTAIVCGASSGMGLGIAEALRDEGVKVMALARREDLLEREATRIGADYLACDLTEPEAPKRAVEEAVERFGGIDIVVWNSGGPPPSPAAEVTADALTSAFESLELPLVRLLEAGLPHLRRSDGGRILAITATGVKEPTPNIALSNALRPGIVGYLKTLSREVAADAVTVNVLAPGRISTPRMEQIFPDGVPAEMESEIPIGRFGTVEEFAAVACFLASAAASYVTGTTIPVDGGLTRSLL
jgi:3-oxoacyl-[acyl-carrier protein] reductase